MAPSPCALGSRRDADGTHPSEDTVGPNTELTLAWLAAVTAAAIIGAIVSWRRA